MKTWIAEQLLMAAFHIANPFSVRGENLRQSIYDYFYRFRFAPAPRRATLIQEFGSAEESSRR